MSEDFANFLIRKFLKRFPVKGARVVFGEGWMELRVVVPVLGTFKARLRPAEPLWGERKALRFRVEEEGSVSLVKTAVQFIREGVRFDGEFLEIDIEKFWARLPEELRWGARIESLKFSEGEAHIFFAEA